MTYQADLAQTGPYKSVAYLSRDRKYPKGEISDSVFDRLVLFAMRPLYASGGVHNCDLDSCESDRPRLELKWRDTTIPSYCSTEILVPDGTWVYVAPALILHYMRAHGYLPPSCFIDAVLVCPEPGSQAYLSELERIVPETVHFIR